MSNSISITDTCPRGGFSQPRQALTCTCDELVGVMLLLWDGSWRLIGYLFWRSFIRHVDEPDILRTGDDR